jgi:DNA-binding beta-propeller fold protein YncE
MTEHLTDNQLVNYVCHTLTDDQRAGMDHHLSACADCRARLAEHEDIQRRIHYRVIAHRNHAVPASRLAYAAIAPRVKRPNRVARFGHWLTAFVSGSLAVAALLALVILLIGMFSGARQTTVNLQATLTPTVVPATPLPPKLVWKIEGQPDPLYRPSGITLDNQGNLYIFDTGNDRVMKYDHDGQFVTQWGGTGRDDGQFYAAGFDNGIAGDAQGDVYVTDIGNARVQKFDSAGKFLLKWEEQVTGAGLFWGLLAVAVDRQGNVYVVARDQNRTLILKYDRNGKFLLKWGEESFAPGQTFMPSAITIDNQDLVYLMDRSYGTIQIFDRSGRFIARWALKCGDNQPVAPLGLTTDTSGNLYVTDYYSNRICKYDPNGQFLNAWGEKGTADGQFDKPNGIIVDVQNNVYVVDNRNDRILKFSQP